MDLWHFVPRLDEYGGAQLLAMECVVRWQASHRITLYSPTVSREFPRAWRRSRLRRGGASSPFWTGPNCYLLNHLLLPRSGAGDASTRCI